MAITNTSEEVVEAPTKHKRFGRVESINRVCRVILETYTSKSYTYTVGIADDQESLVVDEHEARAVAQSVEIIRRVIGTNAYGGEFGSMIRRHNSLFEVIVSKKGSDDGERFFIWLGNDSRPACRVNV